VRSKINKRARDVQFHTVVTITNRVNNVEIFGEKETELPQLCIQVDAKDTPLRRKDVQAAFGAFYQDILKQMRSAGLLRMGD
jgi:hypothetical protein